MDTEITTDSIKFLLNGCASLKISDKIGTKINVLIRILLTELFARLQIEA